MKGVNKSKLGIFLLLVMTISILSVPGILAAITVVLDLPAASGTVTGDTVFNVTISGDTSAGEDVMNITLFAQSTLTANSSWVEIGNNATVNASALATNQTETTIAALGVNNLEDANNYIFNITVKNATGDGFLAEDTNTGITVDNTEPDTPTGQSPASQASDDDGDVTFSATVNGSETTSCTLRFDGQNPGASSYAMTHTADTCSVSLTSMPEQQYSWFVRASDETDTADSSTIAVIVDIPGGGGGGGSAIVKKALLEEALQPPIATKLKTPVFGAMPLYAVISIAVVILVIASAIVFNKKK